MSEARDQTHILMGTSWICFHWATMGTPIFILYDQDILFRKKKKKESSLTWKKVKVLGSGKGGCDM